MGIKAQQYQTFYRQFLGRSKIGKMKLHFGTEYLERLDYSTALMVVMVIVAKRFK